MPVFDYEDIQLVPNKCIVKSRSEVNTKVKFGPMTFKIPVVPANMQTIIDENLAVWLAKNGFSILCTVFMKMNVLILLKICMTKVFLLQFLLE